MTNRSEAWTPEQVRAWVERHGGNVTALARRLRCGRTALQAWMTDKEWGRPLDPKVQAHMETINKLEALRAQLSAIK